MIDLSPQLLDRERAAQDVDVDARRGDAAVDEMTTAPHSCSIMAQPMTAEARIQELHARAVDELVRAHARRQDEPLVLAVRYHRDDPRDVYLFEALEGFPGGDDDPLLSSEFEPSAQLRILGALHLVLGSPAQLRAAVARRDATVAELRVGEVVFDAHPGAQELRALLGL